MRPITPGGLRDCFPSCLSAIGSWFFYHCFNIAAITLCAMKSLLFLCSSGWQGHNLFYDLLGRVAVLYSSLKDTFNNRSNKTPLKKQGPALSLLPVSMWPWLQPPKRHPTIPRRAELSLGGAPCPITMLVMLKEPVNPVEGSLRWSKTPGGWKSGSLSFTNKSV